MPGSRVREYPHGQLSTSFPGPPAICCTVGCTIAQALHRGKRDHRGQCHHDKNRLVLMHLRGGLEDCAHHEAEFEQEILILALLMR
jgi:hypothetical protein